jgi:hypothetical protein
MNATSPLDPDLSNYYDAMFALFATPGWKFLLEDLNRMTQPSLDVRNIKDLDALRFIQGQTDVADWLFGARDRYEAAYTALTEKK